jgi:hypothetical protein
MADRVGIVIDWEVRVDYLGLLSIIPNLTWKELGTGRRTPAKIGVSVALKLGPSKY